MTNEPKKCEECGKQICVFNKGKPCLQIGLVEVDPTTCHGHSEGRKEEKHDCIYEGLEAEECQPSIQEGWEERLHEILIGEVWATNNFNSPEEAIKELVRQEKAASWREGYEEGKAEKLGLLLSEYQKAGKVGYAKAIEECEEAVSKTYDDDSQCESEPVRCIGSLFCPWHQAMNNGRLKALEALDKLKKKV